MSKIIKSNFVSFSEQKKIIQSIDENNPKIIQSSVDSLKNTDLEDDQAGHDDLLNHQFDQNGDVVRVNDADNQSSEFASETGNVGDNDSLDSGTQQSDSHEISLDQQQKLEEAFEEAKNAGFLEGQEEGYAAGFEQGKNEGYQAGQQENQNLINQQLQQNDAELEQLKNQLINEFEMSKRALEPKMLEIIEQLVVKLIGKQEISKGTIMHLIRLGLDELELHGDLVIKVSSFDLDEVVENKYLITEELSEKIKVEILKDQQLEKNDVVIETEMGTIECSLGVQLEGLLSELSLIKESMLRQLNPHDV